MAKKLNKKDLVARLSNAGNISIASATVVFNEFVSQAQKALLETGEVSIPGIGKISLKVHDKCNYFDPRKKVNVVGRRISGGFTSSAMLKRDIVK